MVLASGSDVEAHERIRMADTGQWEPPVHETFHPIPGQPVFVAPPFEGFPPQPADLIRLVDFSIPISRTQIVVSIIPAWKSAGSRQCQP